MTARSWPTAALLAAILALAAALRAIGLTYGLPAIYNPDEVAIMNRALAFGTGDLNPDNFVYPTLYFYVLFAWEGLAFLAGRAGGVFDSIAAFERSFFVDPSFIYTAGRILTLCCGVAAVAAAFVLGRRLFGRNAGLIAAALLATAPLAVRDAHYVKHDVPVTLLIVLAHVALTSAASLRGWILAGALSGLAMSTHYYAIVLVVPLTLAACLEGSARERVGRLLAAGAAAAAAFAATSPFFFADLGLTVRDLAANREIVMDRATDRGGFFTSAPFYARWLMTSGAGIAGCALAAAGVPVAVRGGRRAAIVALAFPLAFFLFTANTYPASRYLNPLLPFLAVLGGAAVSRLAAQGAFFRAAAVALAALALVETGVASARTGLFFRQTDTRTLALRWVEANVPPGASILVQPYSVPLRSSREALIEAFQQTLGSADKASIKFQKQLALQPYPAPAYRAIYLGDGGLDVDRIYVSPRVFDATQDLSPIRAHAVTYVILKRYNEVEPSIASLRMALERDGRRLAVFSPYAGDASFETVPPFLHNTDAHLDRALGRPGPMIEIWAID